jgi:hypothetical protein
MNDLMKNSGMVLLILAVLLATVPALAGTDEETLETRGAEALKPLKQQLMKALVGALQDGGPGEAIKVCSEQAAAIAERVAPPGVTLGRTSHRLRNPDNAPAEWMKPVLAKYAADPALTGATLVPLEDGGHGYVEPIVTRAACLKCHGTDLAPGVAGKLATLYPDDRATGFAEGDFRGLFWARFAPTKPAVENESGK